MTNNIIVKKSTYQIAEYLSVLISKGIKDLSEYSYYNIAISGGSTPSEIFEIISTQKPKDLLWDQVRLFWVDERCVSPDHPDSNYRMSKNSLIDKIDIPEENLFRIYGESDPEKESIRYSSILSEELITSNNAPRFDLILLGLGSDGHTASIFPKNISIFGSMNNCEVSVHPESGQFRITITGKVINNAAVVVFIVTGDGKAEIVKKILSGTNSSEFPATLVNPHNGDLFWLLDGNAAYLIKESIPPSRPD